MNSRERFSSWPMVTGIFAALSAIAGVILHMVGAIAHTTYLHHWSVEADLFPKSTDWLLINGYYGLFERWLAAVRGVASEVLMFLLYSAGFGVYLAFAFALISRPVRAETMVEWLPRLSPTVRVFIWRAVGTLMFLMMLPFVFFLSGAFLAIPGALGEAAGQAIAKRDSAEFDKGCLASKPRCVELRRAGKVVGTGYVLDSSPSYIAILDVATRRALSVPRDGLDVAVVAGLVARAERPTSSASGIKPP
jgi:hypothetical protein